MSAESNSRPKWTEETTGLALRKSRDVIIHQDGRENTEDADRRDVARVTYSSKREEKERQRTLLVYHA